MDRPARRMARRVGILVIVFGLIVGVGFLNGISAAPARADLGHQGTATGAPALVAPQSAASPSPASTIDPAKPVLTLTPSAGVVGITVTANGTGFTASTKITVFTFNGTTPATQTCTAQTTNATGFFTCTFVVPTNVPGAYDVNATGSNGAPDNTTAVFTILTPTILLSPSTGVTGTTVTVSGSGFTRLLTITTFTYNKTTPALQSCVGQAISGFGTWGCEFIVPSSLPGPYNVSAIGSNGAPDNATAVFTILATAVTLQLETGVTTYTSLPFNVILNLTATNAVISPTNTELWLNISDYVTSTICGSNNISSLVMYASAPTGGTLATEYISFVLTNAFFVNDTKACPNLALDSAFFNMTAIVNGGSGGVGVATGYQYGTCAVGVVGWCVPPVTSFVFHPPKSLLNVGLVAGQPYTYAIYANYTAQYVGKVQLSIYNPTATAVILTKNMRWNGTTPTVVTWVQTTPAVYPYTLSVYTAYGVYNSTGSIVVSPATYVYNNATTWSNSTLIPGLGSGGAGTLLLLVGLIVGMIVALVVGRRVWAGPKPAGPAQPWTPKTAEAANTCSVCGRSFATPEELAEHSKSEHGMQ